MSEIRKKKWPHNLWNDILELYTEDIVLPSDWENTLNYVFDNFISDRHKSIITLFYREGMRCKDIANILNEKLSCINTAKISAINALRVYRLIFKFGIEDYDRNKKNYIHDVRDLLIPPKACYSLYHFGITTLDELECCTETELSKMWMIGPKSLEIIKFKLAEIGRSLAK